MPSLKVELALWWTSLLLKGKFETDVVYCPTFDYIQDETRAGANAAFLLAVFSLCSGNPGFSLAAQSPPRTCLATLHQDIWSSVQWFHLPDVLLPIPTLPASSSRLPRKSPSSPSTASTDPAGSRRSRWSGSWWQGITSSPARAPCLLKEEWFDKWLQNTESRRKMFDIYEYMNSKGGLKMSQVERKNILSWFCATCRKSKWC